MKYHITDHTVFVRTGIRGSGRERRQYQLVDEEGAIKETFEGRGAKGRARFRLRTLMALSLD